MATIKSYTDIGQSRKLAEILPLESADGRWFNGYLGCTYSQEAKDFYDTTNNEYIPCWSFAALLGVLPDDCCGIDKEDGKYVASYVVSNKGGTYISDNPVDACYKMILKLHELNLL